MEGPPPHILPSVALVIGNDSYRRKRLSSCCQDAQMMGDRLRALGFAVDCCLDADAATFQQKLEKFHGDVRRAAAQGGQGAQMPGLPHAVCFFYFAGHGVERDGRQFLLPADSDADGSGASSASSSQRPPQVDIEREIVQPLNKVHLPRPRKLVVVVVVDACREDLDRDTWRGGEEDETEDDGFVCRAPSEEARKRVRNRFHASRNDFVFVWACDPGRVALEKSDRRGGNLTTELLNRIDAVGVDFEAILRDVKSAVSEASGNRQRPWVYSQLTFKLVLKPGTARGPGLAAAPLLEKYGLSDLADTLARHEVDLHALLCAQCLDDLSALHLAPGHALKLWQAVTSCRREFVTEFSCAVFASPPAQHGQTVSRAAAVASGQLHAAGAAPAPAGAGGAAGRVPDIGAWASRSRPPAAEAEGALPGGVPFAGELLQMGVPGEMIDLAGTAPDDSVLGAARNLLPAVGNSEAGVMLHRLLASSEKVVERGGRRFRVHRQPQIFSWDEPVKCKVTVTDIESGRRAAHRDRDPDVATEKAFQELLGDLQQASRPPTSRNSFSRPSA